MNKDLVTKDHDVSLSQPSAAIATPHKCYIFELYKKLHSFVMCSSILICLLGYGLGPQNVVVHQAYQYHKMLLALWCYHMVLSAQIIQILY